MQRSLFVRFDLRLFWARRRQARGQPRLSTKTWAIAAPLDVLGRHVCLSILQCKVWSPYQSPGQNKKWTFKLNRASNWNWRQQENYRLINWCLSSTWGFLKNSWRKDLDCDRRWVRHEVWFTHKEARLSSQVHKVGHLQHVTIIFIVIILDVFPESDYHIRRWCLACV